GLLMSMKPPAAFSNSDKHTGGAESNSSARLRRGTGRVNVLASEVQGMETQPGRSFLSWLDEPSKDPGFQAGKPPSLLFEGPRSRWMHYVRDYSYMCGLLTYQTDRLVAIEACCNASRQ